MPLIIRPQVNNSVSYYNLRHGSIPLGNLTATISSAASDNHRLSRRAFITLPKAPSPNADSSVMREKSISNSSVDKKGTLSLQLDTVSTLSYSGFSSCRETENNLLITSVIASIECVVKNSSRDNAKFEFSKK